MFLKVVIPLLAVFMTVSTGGLGGIAGGLMDADLNREDVRYALRFAIQHHNRMSNDLYISRVSRVFSAQQQVVAGTNYFFTVELARTTCRKGYYAKGCYIHPDPRVAQHRVCRMMVWVQSWTNTIQVIENTCL